MPQPAEVHQLADPFISAYRRAWERVLLEQQVLVADPLAYRRRARLVEMRRSIETVMNEIDGQASSWIANNLPLVFSAGGATGASGAGLSGFMFDQISQQAVQTLATELFHELLAATQEVKDSTKALIRAVARDEALQKAIEGRTAKQAAVEMTRILETRSINSVVYANGAKVGLDSYAEMAIRTTTATAYNTGTLHGAPEVQFFEIFDGPFCGLTRHDDPTLAHGLVVDRFTAGSYLISHPNCRRAFGARPDIVNADSANGVQRV